MFAKIQNKKIFYKVEGKKGKKIILVHGWGGSVKSLQKIATYLSKKHQIISLDLPGFGKSEDPKPDWGIKEYSQIIVGLLKKIKVKKVNYFGHSFGGSLGIYLAANYPKLINNLIVCAPSFRRKKKKSKISFLMNNFLSVIPFSSLRIFIKKILYRIFFPKSTLMAHPNLQTNFKKILQQDLTKYIKNISQKTLILWGEDDSYVPLAYGKLLHRKIKNNRLKVYKDESHNLPLKRAKIVAQEIEKEIKNNS